MFFLVRSTFCIGIVATLAMPGQPRLPAVIREGVPIGAVAAAASLAAPNCHAGRWACLARQVIGDIAAAPSSGKPPASRRTARPSRDTLTPDDRKPSWTGPLALARNGP